MPFQNLFPQIGGLITSRIIGITRASCTALVKREKMRVPPRNAGGHVNLICIYGEMDKRPLPELEDQVRRVTVMLVLIDRVPLCLSGHGVFKLGRGNGYSIERQGYVQGVTMPARISELACNCKAIGIIEPLRFGVQAACRREAGRTEELPEALEAMAQDREASFMLRIERPAEVIEKYLPGLVF